MAFTAQDQKPDTMNYIQQLFDQIKGLRGLVGGILSNIASVLSFVPGGAIAFYDSNGTQLMRIGYLTDGTLGINLQGNNIINGGSISGGPILSTSYVYAPNGVSYGFGNYVKIQKTSATRLDIFTSS